MPAAGADTVSRTPVVGHRHLRSAIGSREPADARRRQLAPIASALGLPIRYERSLGISSCLNEKRSTNPATAMAMTS